MQKAKLTVFIPNYNKGKYIAQALNSVLMQKTNFSFIVLIIDDASTDDSANIIESFVKKYPEKIVFLKNKKNLGALATSLIGYEKIKTQYFCVLDPDDYWIKKDKLQKAIDFLDKNQDFTIYVSNNYIKESNKLKTPYFKDKSINFDFCNLDKAISGHTSGTIFRNIVFPKGISKDVYAVIGSKNEKIFEGDTFRNMIHLKEGRGHYENNIESVYRITNDGIWTSMNQFQKNLFNAKSFLKLFLFFNKVHPEFFIEKCLIYCQKSFLLFNSLSDNEKLKKNKEEEFLSWKETFYECLKYKNKFLKENSNNELYQTFLFFLPSKTVGGYEFLFMRLAKFLSEKLYFNVFYIDYQDGFVKKQLNKVKTKIKFINYSEDDTLCDLDVPVNLITPITMSHEIPHLRNSDSKLIFWCAHPKSISWLSYRSGMKDKKLYKFLLNLNKSNAVCFMDWACWQASKKISKIKFLESYVPIFTNEKKIKENHRLVNQDEINIGWLGRLDSDKIYSLINVIDQLYHLPSKRKKNIHIIGDGDSKQLIDVNKYSKKVNIIFTSTLINSRLQKYITEKVDVLFAMGTSLLEGASFKIPSVIVFATENKLNQKEFVWLFDSKNYTLGFYPNQKSELSLKTTSLPKIIEDVYEKNKKGEMGSKCYSYFLKNHNIDQTVTSLLSFITKNNFKYKSYNQNEIKTLYVKKRSIVDDKRSKIFVSFFNGITDPKNDDAMPCFYESFLAELRQAGNNVLYYSNKHWNNNIDHPPSNFLNKIKDFNPDLIILFNNNCYDLTSYFDCPILIWEVDSPLYFSNKQKIKQHPNRYEFIIAQSSSRKTLELLFDIKKAKIHYLPFATSIVAESIPQTTNISFIGTKFQTNNLVGKFMTNGPNDDEVEIFKKIYNYVEKFPFSTEEELISKFKIDSNKITNQFSVQSFVENVSFKKRVQVLSTIADLGLDLFGTKNWIENMDSEPEIMLSYKNKLVYSKKQNQDVYNSSKISININHAQAQTGFSWRVCDIMASNSCLVSEPAKDFKGLFPNLKIPTYTNRYEAREVCQKILSNESMRREIIASCQEVINKKHRFFHIIKHIEQITSLSLRSKDLGTLNKISEIESSIIKRILIKNSKKFRTETRKKLMLYSTLMLINQIPVLNKPLMSRSEIFDNIKRTIEKEENI